MGKRGKRMMLRPGYGWSKEKGFHKIKPYRTMKETTQDPAAAVGANETLTDLLAAASVSIPYGNDVEREPGQVAPAAFNTMPTPAELVKKLTPNKKVKSAPESEDNVFIEKGFLAPEVTTQKFFFTGRLAAGKDYLANAIGAKVISFAEPLYAMASYYFDIEVTADKNKDLPGVRDFLQKVGQWGRAVVSPAYPLTPERALFTAQVRLDGSAACFGHKEIDWSDFGKDPGIWLNAALARATDETAPRLAITNCRFANEFESLSKAGWKHYHVMCSAKTWAARLAKKNLTTESPELKDTSEQLAIKLDSSVIKQVSAQKTGATLRAVWCDDVPKPSNRLHSVSSLLESIKGAQ